MINRRLSLLRAVARNKPMKFNRATVRSNFSAAKKGAEEVQDEFQATKVSRIQRGSNRRMRLKPVMRLQPESKFVYRTNSSTALTNGTPVVIDLINTLRSVDNEDGRIGDKILVKTILSRVQLAYPTSAVLGESSVVRAILVYDRQSNGATIDVPKLLEDPARALSPLNSDNAGRYKILWDKIVPLVADTNKTLQLITQNNIYKMGLNVNYNTALAEITAVQRGNIALVLLLNVATSNTTPPTFQYDIKITYQDI